MPFAAALSEHPVTAMAVGEVAGQVLERLGQGPDLALLFVTHAHGGALEDAGRVVAEVVRPSVLLGCVADSIAGPGQEVEGSAAVSLWAGHVGLHMPVALSTRSVDGQLAVVGWPEGLSFEPQALLLMGDPYSFPIEPFLASLAEVAPGLPVVGGMATGANTPGGTRLLLDDHIHSSGAIGVLLGPGCEIETVVSQGCRPVGHPYVVTRSEGNLIHEIAGQPTLDKLQHILRTELGDADRAQVRQPLPLGIAFDEYRTDFGPGDFLIRNILGIDRASGAVALGDEVPVGSTVQLHVHDAATADDELRRLLAGKRADGALLFTCNGRGRNLFEAPDHDAGVLAEELGEVPAAGFFANGELGPIGGRNYVHGFTASVVLFREGVRNRVEG